MGNGKGNLLDTVVGSSLDFGFDQLSGAISAKRARKFWRMQNEYNHPREQMQRLEEAGLNPNLVYGSKSGGINQSASLTPPAIPNTSRYQDARMKSAQLDLVQLNSDLARQKLEQARIATEAQKQVHGIMMSHPDRIVSVTGPDGATMEISQPNEMDRYQTQAIARHGAVLDDARIKELDAFVKGETSVQQAFANLARTRQLTASERQRTQSLLNNNRLWSALDDMVNKSANRKEVFSLVLKMLLNSAGARAN